MREVTQGATVPTPFLMPCHSYVEAMYAMVPPSMPRPARIVDKMLRNLWHVGYIDLMLPGAKVVHVMRHPLDAGRGPLA